MWQFLFLEIWYLNFAMMFLNIHWLGYVCRVEDGLIFSKFYPEAQYLVPLEQLGWSEAFKWDNSWHTLWFCSWMAVLLCFLGKELCIYMVQTDGWWNLTKTSGILPGWKEYFKERGIVVAAMFEEEMLQCTTFLLGCGKVWPTPALYHDVLRGRWRRITLETPCLRIFDSHFRRASYFTSNFNG